MAWQKTSLALLLSFIIVFSSIALIQLQKNNQGTFNSNNLFDSLTFFTPTQYAPVLFGHTAFKDVAKISPFQVISNSTRAEVYNLIATNPGIQFRGICTELGIAIGTAEFHLGVLKKAGLVSFVRDGKYKRFFLAKKFSLREMKLISLLRHGTVKDILAKIMNEQAISHNELACHLSITSQGLSWQMNRLLKEGIVQKNANGIGVTYTLNEPYIPILPEFLQIL